MILDSVQSVVYQLLCSQIKGRSNYMNPIASLNKLYKRSWSCVIFRPAKSTHFISTIFITKQNSMREYLQQNPLKKLQNLEALERTPDLVCLRINRGEA